MDWHRIRSRSRGLRGLALLAAISGEGWLFAYRIAFKLADWPSASFFLLTTQEPVAFALMLAVAVSLLGFVILRRPSGTARAEWNPARVHVAVASLALAAGGTALAGHYLVYHDHALAMDEFMTRFGEGMLLRGDLLARIPEAWRSFAVPLQPIFTFFAPADGLWGNSYRPVNAAVHALSARIFGVDAIANATLTALAVILVAAVARRLWPTRSDAAVLAAILVATSPQVLITGMTLYAMPGHLALNLAWLWLFLCGGRLGHGLAGVAGCVRDAGRAAGGAVCRDSRCRRRRRVTAGFARRTM